jgi:hypothetical protein
MPGHLTSRQTTVLEGIKRLRNPTIPELKLELPEFTASSIWRVIEALEAKRLVVVAGDRQWRYLGDPKDFPPGSGAPDIAAERVVRVSAT